MLFLSFCLSLLYCTRHVLASAGAGPYQAIWLWYAYTIDGMRQDSEIALQCSGSGPGGRCLFDEFLNSIEENGGAYHTTVGNNELPDVDQTAQELKSQGYKGNVDPGKLLPQLAGFNPARRPKFEDVHGPIMDVVQKARKELNDDERIALLLTPTEKALTGISINRAAEQAKDLINAFEFMMQDRYKLKGYKADKVVKTMNGVSWEHLDTTKIGASLNTLLPGQSPKASAKAVNLVTNFVQDYNNGNINGVDPKKNAVKHMAALRFAQSLESRLRDPNFC